MFSKLAHFCRDEDGAVTVDFVVLTAAICLLGVTVVTIFQPGATNLANSVENQLGNQGVDFVERASQY